MNKKNPMPVDQLNISIKKTSYNTLFPCIYELSEENDNSNSSQNSIDSSELVDDTDEGVEIISKFHILSKGLDKNDKKNVENVSA